MSNYSKFVPAPAVRVPLSSNIIKWGDTRMHVLRVGDPNAPVRIIMLHGAGGNAAAMQPFAEHLSLLGAYVSIPDLPGYGLTTTDVPGKITYDYWQMIVSDFVRTENDDRPLVLIGASVGGLLAYEVAATTGLSDALVATCFLDPREDAVLSRISWSPVLGRVAGKFLKVTAGPLAQLRIPTRWIADMRYISNNPAMVKAVISDKRGGGGKMTLGWMRSFLEWSPKMEPEQFSEPRVLMVHPAEDKWTPLAASLPFFDRIAAPKDIVMLDKAGHFPIEQPGLDQMLAAVDQLLQEIKK